MVNMEIKIPCPFKGGHDVVLDRGELAEPRLIHCQAWMNYCLSGGCRCDGCIFLHIRSVRLCPFVKLHKVVKTGYVRPEKYQPLFLNESKA